MPLFFFHVDDGQPKPQASGIEFPDREAVQDEAVRAAGEMLTQLDGDIWRTAGRTWRMDVTDEQKRLLFTLRFSVEVPSS